MAKLWGIVNRPVHIWISVNNFHYSGICTEEDETFIKLLDDKRNQELIFNKSEIATLQVEAAK